MLSPRASRVMRRVGASTRRAPPPRDPTRSTFPVDWMMPVNIAAPRGVSLLELGSVEQLAEPAVVLALGDHLQLTLVDPGAAVGRTLQHVDPVQGDRVEGGAAARAVPQGQLDDVEALDLPQALDRLALLLREEAVLLALFPLLQALPQAVLAVFHRPGCRRPRRRSPPGPPAPPSP